MTRASDHIILYTLVASLTHYAHRSILAQQVFSELGVHFYDFTLSACALDSAELRFAHSRTARGECQVQPLEFSDVFRAFYSVFPSFHCDAESAHAANMHVAASTPAPVSSASSTVVSSAYVFGAWPPRTLLNLWQPLASTVWLPNSLVLGHNPSNQSTASSVAHDVMVQQVASASATLSVNSPSDIGDA